MNITLQKITVDKLKNLYHPFGVDVDVLRLDRLHPVISGNKWFKLHPYLDIATETGKKQLITFGGAFSNHIVAVAAAGQAAQLETTGIIRGEQGENLSPTLQDATHYGMKLVFISREAYKQKIIPAFLKYSEEDSLLIPEGGYGHVGRKGAEMILKTVDTSTYTHAIAAVGTGTMLAGLVNAAGGRQQITGISVMKNNNSLKDTVNAILPEGKENDFIINHDFHFGGYAKYNN